MKLKKIEKKKDKLTVEVVGEDHTLLNALRENAWREQADQAAYMLEHPYLANPKIIVRSADPKKTLTSAAQLLIDEAQEFQKEFKRAQQR
ncbi:MAG: DNA-directed RNA polymerase subunit L [Candidatus Aenigmarchaeota archaeon]|nr:DNA-directed RNA polymerase subunit L [Candidatus Aenigmarchaeota archaeon]